jgi:hypothetical protein
MGVDHEAEDTPFASADQVQQLDMIVAPNSNEEPQTFGAEALRARAR